LSIWYKVKHLKKEKLLIELENKLELEVQFVHELLVQPRSLIDGETVNGAYNSAGE
jgi:hypothetical protein